ncbi:MAG: XkdX family protein [Firmicutes bacterium]|nr:XkdX family protein [Bacillota bacterium]
MEKPLIQLVIDSLGGVYETLLRLWREGKLTEVMLDNAVTKGWITVEQKVEIMSQ